MTIEQILSTIKPGLASELTEEENRGLAAAGYRSVASLSAATIEDLRDRDPPELCQPIARMVTHACGGGKFLGKY